MGNKNHYVQNAKTSDDQLKEIETLIGKTRSVEVVDCAAVNLREYPNGPVTDVCTKGTRLTLSDTKSEYAGWTIVKSPSKSTDVYVMSHFVKEV